MTTNSDQLASQQGHWYHGDGRPCYEVEAKKGGMRATTITDAKKLSLVPSVTAILNVAAKPGLEAWKTKQILEAALTLPKLPDETLDDYAVRVMEDSKAQGKKARDKGTELHAGIEEHIQNPTQAVPIEWHHHVNAVKETLLQHGIDIMMGRAEHSFASPLGYGGKIDLTLDEPLILDFKTKAKIEDGKQLSWPEHIQQLSAYGFGLFGKYLFGVVPLTSETTKFRALNVFIGVEDKQVRVVEYEWPDIVEAFAQFRCLLEFWQRIKKFGPYSK